MKLPPAQRIRTPFVLVAALLASACASQVPTTTALLADTPLVPAEGNANRLSFRSPRFEPSNYDGWVLDRVTFAVTDQTSSAADQVEQAALILHLEASLDRVLGKHLQRRETAGPRTLMVRAAVTGAERANPVVNTITTLAVFAPVTTGGAATEIEARDALTGERLLALAGADNGSPLKDSITASFSRYGHARRALDRQATDFAALVGPAVR